MTFHVFDHRTSGHSLVPAVDISREGWKTASMTRAAIPNLHRRVGLGLLSTHGDCVGIWTASQRQQLDGRVLRAPLVGGCWHTSKTIAQEALTILEFHRLLPRPLVPPSRISISPRREQQGTVVPRTDQTGDTLVGPGDGAV